MLQCTSVCHLSIFNVCIVAKRYVLEQALLLTDLEKSIGTKMNDLDLHVNHCATFAIEYLGNR